MIYLLQVNLGIILFYALYKLICTRDTFFNSRRLILMLALILPFIIPLIDIREWMETRDSLVMLTNFDYSTTIPEIVVGTAGTEPGNQVFVISEWIKYIYIAGILALSVRLIVQAISLYMIILRTPEKTVNGIRIKCMKDKSGPFSFFNWIFLNPDNVKEEEMSEILTHEMAHVRQKHSIDVIISELVNICCWINPFAWLMKREVRLNLEFLADRKVMDAGFATKSYQYHLLGLTYSHKYGLSNNFNFSHLKQRIIMMNKKKTNGAGHIKYALFTIPAFALLLAGNISCSSEATKTDDVKENAATEKANEAEVIVQEPATKGEAFAVVEQMPEFPGGMKELMTYLKDNIKYPKAAQDKKVQGRVIVQFVVEKDGTPTEFNVLRSVDPDLDAEALRVLGGMPKWKPGMQKGQVVRVKYTVPVAFRLQ
ncbi:M56 family metallopeptidase [Bacteroides caecigallinarum]|uniref:M56 family metallopeptidase n=1 Tax=Bacteroides caecigallinarum TaxID=1411144 RepID=UPI00195672EF|nr:M56 family metallopeptidase [Bacteroides caecigallinarum]MBM6889041.1 M56 family metallopeptidase [Bacteroides caecigallinarum]